MAGLSDAFGDSWDDPKSQAIMALAGGLMGGDWKSGLLGYSKVMSGAGEAKMASDIKKAQLLKYANDIEMDKGKLALDQGKAKRTGDFESMLMKMMEGGNATAAPDMPVTGLQSADGVANVGKRTDPFAGVDRTALMLDYMQNGGKKMGDWVNDRTKPDMKVTNGYAYDNNRLGAGFMPFLNTDASGKTSMGRIGADGVANVGRRTDPFAGVDRTALMLDYMQNGGKKMGDWVNDRTKPDMQVTNGYAYDKNRLGAGFMPFLNTDASGKTSMGRIGADGMPIVSAPQGAVDTFNAYRNADEAIKNKNSVTTVTLPGGGTSMVTNDALLNAARGGQPAPAQPIGQRPVAAGSEAQIIAQGLGGLNGLPATARGGNVSFKSTPQEMDKPRILQDALSEASTRFAAAQKSGDTANMQRAMSDIEGIRREIGGGKAQPAPSFGLPLQSLSEKERTSADNKAYETKLVEQAKADIQPTQAKQANISAAENAISLVDKALNHKGLGVATGLSGAIDPRNYIPGQVGKDYKAIQSQLEGKAFLSAFEQLKGGGAISEKEGEKAQQAIARMSLSQSEQEYRQGLKDYKEVIQTGLNRMQGKENKPKEKSLQDYGYKSNDDVLRDARNTVMRNPQARGEVEKRLKAMGLSLGGQ